LPDELSGGEGRTLSQSGSLKPFEGRDFEETRSLLMIDPPRITQTAAFLTAYVHVTVPREEIRTVMGPGLDEVRAAIAAQGIAAVGPWFTHHLKMQPGIFDFEICVPVAAPVDPVGRVKPGQWPVTTVARTISHGDYEGLGAAWGEFNTWIAGKGYTPRPDMWECYLAGPESSADPSAWRTELNRPLVD
jgi:effector-binding domain-containing protein